VSDPTKVLVHNEQAGSGGIPTELFHEFTEVELDELEGFLGRAKGEILVAVWGGDGTCRSVACLAVNQLISVLPCPGGTHNHFAKAAGFASCDDVARSLFDPSSRLVNVGTINDDLSQQPQRWMLCRPSNSA
jgi:diacylglycerol kinase family enzyme